MYISAAKTCNGPFGKCRSHVDIGGCTYQKQAEAEGEHRIVFSYLGVLRLLPLHRLKFTYLRYLPKYVFPHSPPGLQPCSNLPAIETNRTPCPTTLIIMTNYKLYAVQFHNHRRTGIRLCRALRTYHYIQSSSLVVQRVRIMRHISTRIYICSYFVTVQHAEIFMLQ